MKLLNLWQGLLAASLQCGVGSTRRAGTAIGPHWPAGRHSLARMRIGVVLLFLVAVAPVSLSQTSPATAKSSPSRPLLVLGDSLSSEYGLKRGSGWVALLSARLSSENIALTVVNASISGETTAGGKSRIEALLRKHSPAWVLIELGGNDALRGLDLAGTEANLRAMARAARAAGAQVVIIGMQVPPNYGRAYSRQFAGLFEQAARDEQAVLVPFLLEGIGDRLELFQADRIHPNEAAQPKMLENVWAVIGRRLRSGRG